MTATSTALTDQISDIVALWKQTDIWPRESINRAEADLTAIADLARGRNVDCLTRIHPTDLRVWLARRVGAHNTNAGMSGDSRHAANRIRNTLVCAITTVAFGRDETPAELAATLDTVAAIQPRTGYTSTKGVWSAKARPAYDDEIACLRAHTTFQLALVGGPTVSAKSILSYIICDAGIANNEAACVTRASIDDVAAPKTISVYGNDFRAERTVTLDTWQSQTLRHGIAHSDNLAALIGNTESDVASLVYSPRRAGADNAANTVCNAVRNLIGRSGMCTPDLKPNGVSNWRPARLVRAGRYDDARAVSGLGIKQLAAFID